jgi:hypothetical protein
MRSEISLLSRYRKPANFAYNLLIFHNHCKNISWITNQKVVGDRAARTAQSTYQSCYDMMKTPILNCSQRGGNHKVGTVVWFQPGRKPTGLCPVRVTTQPRESKSDFWPSLELNKTELLGENRTTSWLPGPIAKGEALEGYLYFESTRMPS